MHVIHSQKYPSLLCQVTGSRSGGGETDRRTRAAEEDRDTCDLEVMSQSLILPPTDRPYFLLLQGYDQSKARHASSHLSYSHAMTSYLYSSNHNIPSALSYLWVEWPLNTLHKTAIQKLYIHTGRTIPTQACCVYIFISAQWPHTSTHCWKL